MQSRIIEPSALRTNTNLPYLVIFLVAVAVRLAYFYEYRLTPYYDTLRVDALQYDQWGWSIAQGYWLGNQVFFQAPLYPYFLGAIYTLIGHVPSVIYITQALIGSITAILIVYLARRISIGHPGREHIAWISGLLFAVATPVIFYEFLILKVSLGLFLIVLELILLVRIGELVRAANGMSTLAFSKKAIPLVIAGGIVLGFCILIRGNYLLLSPIFAAWIAWSYLTGAQGHSRGKRYSTLAAVIGGYALGALIVVTPVTIRNYVVGDEFVLTTSQAGLNFFIGNHEGATGSIALPEGMRSNPKYEALDAKMMAEEAEGRTLRWSEVSTYYYRQAWSWIVNNPTDAARLYAKKLALWLLGYEIGDNYDFQFVRDHYAKTLKIPVATGYTLGLLGWIAIVILMAFRNTPSVILTRENPNLILLASFALGYSVSVLPFIVLSRYRIPIYPVLALFSAALVIDLITRVRALSRGRIIATASIGIVIAALVFRSAYQPDWPEHIRNDTATGWNDLGWIYLQKGDNTSARKMFTLAREELERIGLPLNSDARMYIDLMRFELAMGRSEQALAMATWLVDRKPQFRYGWYNLGLVALKARNWDSAETALRHYRSIETNEDVRIRLRNREAPTEFALGLTYLRQGHPQLARVEFKKLILDDSLSIWAKDVHLLQVVPTLLRGNNANDYETAVRIFAKATVLTRLSLVKQLMGQTDGRLYIRRFKQALSRMRASNRIDEKEYKNLMNSITTTISKR